MNSLDKEYCVATRLVKGIKLFIPFNGVYDADGREEVFVSCTKLTDNCFVLEGYKSF